MNISVFIMIIAVTFLSSLTQTVTGFGFAIVLMALMPLFLPYDISLMLSLIFGGVMCTWILLKFRKYLQPRYFLIPLVFSSLGAISGLLMGRDATPAIYMRLLGILLFTLSIWFLFLSERIRIQTTPLTGAISGIISGLMGAMFSIGGPPLVLYFGAATDDKDIYIASLQACFLPLGIISITGRIMLGLWPANIEAYLLPAVIGLICGIFPGLWIHNKTDAAQLKKIVYIFMCVAGIYMAITA